MTTVRSIDELFEASSPPVGPADSLPRREPRFTLWLFSFTIFSSAFLLFQVEPLIAKLVLPWFGGTAGVWSACMLFFQVLLFGGYAYAHVTTSRLRPWAQTVLHVLLLATACAALPILPSESWKPAGDEEPIGRIMGLLGVTVGLPFFILSATNPLLQAWFSRAQRGRSVYRLYALSNAGSLLALVSFPAIFDWLFATRFLARVWSWGFAAFAVVCGACAWCRPFARRACRRATRQRRKPASLRSGCRRRFRLTLRRLPQDCSGSLWRWFRRSCSWRRRIKCVRTLPACRSCGSCH